MKIRTLFIATALLAAFAVPMTASAAPDWLPIVQCGGTNYDGSAQKPCTPCEMFKVANNLTNFILQGVTGPVAAFMIVLGGGMFLIGADSPTMQMRARAILTNTAIGVVVILLAWVFVNFLIKTIGGGSSTDRWYEFSCPDFLSGISVPTGDAPPAPSFVPIEPLPKAYIVDTAQLSASQMQQIAKNSGARYPYGDSSTLEQLISCLTSDPVIMALAVPRQDWYTYERSKPVCNYTRGRQIGAGACSHSENSCHYGGSTGTQGSEAVDINARGGAVTIPGLVDKDGKSVPVTANEGTLFCQIQRVYASGKCGVMKFVNWEPDDGGNGHTHLSTTSCKEDGIGVKSQKNVPLPDCANTFRLPQK